MRWEASWRYDPVGARIADRHYSRQTVGSPQFVPPGRCMVLRTPEASALWVTSWPNYAQHDWNGAWNNTLFRNERPDIDLSSDLILEAIACTVWKWIPPPHGMITMIDPEKTRRKRDPGRCYRRAGFHEVGRTRSGLLVLQMFPQEMPLPCAPHDPQESFDFGGAA